MLLFWTKTIIKNMCKSQSITDKFNGGKISIANYSDVIRMALLYQYGGYWIDSTVLLSDGWDDYSNLPFLLSIKNPSDLYRV